MYPWEDQSEPLSNPIWTANLGKRGKFFFHRPIAGSFSINKRNAKPGRDFTPGYANKYGFVNPVKASQWIPDFPLFPELSGKWPKRKSLDIPASRFTRFQRILREGQQHYEFFGMKVPITEEMRSRPTWTSARLRGEAQHHDMGVLLFAKHKYSGRSQGLGWMAEMAVPEESLTSLLPALENVPIKTPFRMNLPGIGTGKWFFGQRRASAAQINAFAPRDADLHTDRISGKQQRIFQRTWRTPSLRRWAKRNAPAAIAAGAVVGLGLYALNRFGQQITTPQTITTPSDSPPYSPAASPTQNPFDYRSLAESHAWNMAYGQAGMGKPLNEMAMLDKPIHHAIGFEGSWLSGAWRRFHDTVLTSKTAVDVFERIGASAVKFRTGPIFSPPSSISIFGRPIKNFPAKIIYSPTSLAENSPNMPNTPLTAFHEMVEQAIYERSGTRRLIEYSSGGSHLSLKAVTDELRGAEVYDAVHGLGAGTRESMLSKSLALRKYEMLTLEGLQRDKSSDRYLKALKKITKRYQRFDSQTGAALQPYSFIKEIEKGHGNVRDYFPEGWIEGIRQSKSQHNTIEGLADGPVAKAHHKKLTDFGSGRDADRQLTKTAIAQFQTADPAELSRLAHTPLSEAGSTASVRGGVFNGHPFVAKMFRDQDSWNQTTREAFEEEVSSLKRVAGIRGIPEYLGSDPKTRTIFMEHMTGSELPGGIQTFEPHIRRRISRQLGATYLRAARRGIRPADISHKNLLITAGGHANAVDTGLWQPDKNLGFVFGFRDDIASSLGLPGEEVRQHIPSVYTHLLNGRIVKHKAGRAVSGKISAPISTPRPILLPPPVPPVAKTGIGAFLRNRKNWPIIGLAAAGLAVAGTIIGKRIEGRRRQDSEYGFDTMGGGPTSKALHKKLTDFGSGRDEDNEVTQGVASETMSLVGYGAIAAGAGAVAYGGLRYFSKAAGAAAALPDKKLASTGFEKAWHWFRLRPQAFRRKIEKWGPKIGNKVFGTSAKPWKLPKHMRKHWGKYYLGYEIASKLILAPLLFHHATKKHEEGKRLEGIRKAKSENSIADGIADGPMAKGQHTTLTDFGSGRHALRQLTKSVKVLSPSVMREQAIGSGIRSQRKRLARLPNTSSRPGSPTIHRNKTRAGV